MSPALRDAMAADLPWIVDQERQIFGPSAWSRDLISQDFRYGFNRYRIAELDGESAGYAIYGFDGDAFHLMNLATSPNARRRGVARVLLEDFLSEAERLGAPDAWLEVAITNEPALALYEAHGFERIRVRPKYYQPEGIDAVVMRVRVPAGGYGRPAPG